MERLNTRVLATVLLTTGLMAGAPALAADNYPNAPIHMIVPFAAGGPTDTLARTLAEAMGKELGQKVIVDNKPGAGGNVGFTAAKRARPDGYTVVIGTNGPLVANTMLFKDLPFDPKKDFDPVSLITYLPNMLAVHPDVPAKNTQELIELLKKNPDKYSFASGGLGTSTHFAGEMFKTMAGVKMTHVPYKGDGASMPDVVGGQVPIVFGSVFATARFIEGGMLRGLAVTSIDRVPAVKDIPTLDETGLKGYDFTAWYGMVVPAGTPQPIIEKLSKTIANIVADPDFRARIEGMGGILRSMTPTEFAQFIDSERPKWETAIKESGITVE